MRKPVIALAALGLSACQTNAPPAASMAPTGKDRPMPVITFAQGACGDCHAVQPNWLSPNPNAPTFASIANRKGLTAQTLSAWLRDAHNYPEAMDFDLTPERAEELASYIATLRDDSYKPAP